MPAVSNLWSLLCASPTCCLRPPQFDGVAEEEVACAALRQHLRARGAATSIDKRTIERLLLRMERGGQIRRSVLQRAALSSLSASERSGLDVASLCGRVIITAHPAAGTDKDLLIALLQHKAAKAYESALLDDLDVKEDHHASIRATHTAAAAAESGQAQSICFETRRLHPIGGAQLKQRALAAFDIELSQRHLLGLRSGLMHMHHLLRDTAGPGACLLAMRLHGCILRAVLPLRRADVMGALQLQAVKPIQLLYSLPVEYFLKNACLPSDLTNLGTIDLQSPYFDILTFLSPFLDTILDMFLTVFDCNVLL